MKKIIAVILLVLLTTLASFLYCKPFAHAVCNALIAKQDLVLKKQCLNLSATDEITSVLIPLSRNLNEREPVLVDTTVSLPITDLKCAVTPASNLVVNVKEQGAKGDGVNNDTAAIQAAVELVKNTGGSVLVPPGVYMIDAVKHINLRDHMTFRMEPGVVLKALPNDRENFSILKIKQVSNVNVVGGILQGERGQHQGTTGEWGMGLEVNGAKHVIIERVIAKDNWGDGFYVSEDPVDTVFCEVVADNNRRQGMSVVSADGIVIKDSIFQRTNGIFPKSGLDIEPNIGKTVNNFQVTGSQFLQNKGNGLISTMSEGNVGLAVTKNGLIEGNLMANNGTLNDYYAGIMFYHQKGIKVINNVIKNNLQDGMSLNTGSVDNHIIGNSFINNGNPVDKKYGRGIFIYQANKNIIENNTVTNNFKYDIHDYPADNTLKNNVAKKVKIGPAE